MAVTPREKPLVWLHGEIKTPPFSAEGRIEAGYLLGLLQQGEKLSLSQSRPNVKDRCRQRLKRYDGL